MKKVLAGVLIMLALVTGLWLALGQPSLFGGYEVTGTREVVTLLGPRESLSMEATIDTGASMTSIDRDLALSLGFTPDSRQTVTIITSAGSDERDTVVITFRLGARRITARASVENRSGMSSLMLVGRRDLAGFLVDPEREFISGSRASVKPVSADRITGSREIVLLAAPAGEVSVEARVDTGAAISSIDEELALSLGYVPDETEMVRIVTSEGVTERRTVRLAYRLGDRRIESRATLEDRSALSTRMLIGRDDLKGIMVNPAQEFILSGDGVPGGALSFLQLPTGMPVQKVLLVIPALGALVVLARLLLGLRTFGIFSPVVIAISLIEIDIIKGSLLYIGLVGVGVGLKLLLLNRLRLAHIAELCLVMFVLVAALAGLASVAGNLFPLTSLFFPLIITSLLVEHVSRSLEEHEVGEVLRVMSVTLAVALALAWTGAWLLSQSVAVLVVSFGAGVLVAFFCGSYLGLRLTELVRFRFLRRTHVHW